MEKIFTLRCVSCHSEKPTDDIWKIAPNNVKFDSSDEIVKMKDKILTQRLAKRSIEKCIERSNRNSKISRYPSRRSEILGKFPAKIGTTPHDDGHYEKKRERKGMTKLNLTAAYYSSNCLGKASH